MSLLVRQKEYTSAAFPPELFDETLDHLWDDPKSLKACSLACRAWVPTTRLHLFRTVLLTSLSSTARFSALLDSTPDIAWHVRKLSITAQYSRDVDHDNNEDNAEGLRTIEDDGWVNTCVGIAQRLGETGRVNTLALSRMRWSHLESSTKEAFKGLFKNVRALFLFEIRFRTSGDVLEFLDAFPDLDELYFHAVSWDHDSNTPLVPTPPATNNASDWLSMQPRFGQKDKMHLTYLFLDPRSSPTLVTEWLLSHPLEKKLRTIQLCWREMDGTKALGDLLQVSGSSLERLQIEFPSGIPEEAVLHNHLSLAHNTSLRSLSFGGLDVSAASSRAFLSTHLFPWVTQMLADLRSPLLHEITFELETPNVSGLRTLDWVSIDQELSRREFIGLTVRFYVDCNEGGRGDNVEQEVRKEIEERLKGFKERGVLRVNCI
ncbi:hypothetical protein PHLCEN_2v9136 [Hermanssonia centrifuga]|uniref:F-box domain-containing protein n=1 Tax=Hermanssonia centrifuga TaxID=98765 RepID=A0A2R6NRK0_9APHY|nr:hypothetical protein PHLCEN_2v9136 [Hermanssonia centrifuga]